MMSGLNVVYAETIDQNESLAKPAAPNRHIRLNAVRGTLPHVDGRVELEQIGKGVCHQLLGTHIEDANRAVSLFKRNRFERTGDDDNFTASGGVGCPRDRYTNSDQRAG